MSKVQAKKEIKEMDDFLQTQMTSKRKAHAYLVKVGIVDKKGKVAKRYRD